MRFRDIARSCAGAAVLLAACAPAARGGEFTMSLQVSRAGKTGKKADGKFATKLTREQPTAKKRPARLVFKGETDQRLTVKWKALNGSKSATYKDVLVHFFVVAEKKAGQPKVPPLGKDAAEHEGAVTLDFKPGDRAEGEFSLTIRKAGSYLVRVETVGLAGREGHECYAALDLVLK